MMNRIKILSSLAFVFLCTLCQFHVGSLFKLEFFLDIFHGCTQSNNLVRFFYSFKNKKNEFTPDNFLEIPLDCRTRRSSLFLPILLYAPSEQDTIIDETIMAY